MSAQVLGRAADGRLVLDLGGQRALATVRGTGLPGIGQQGLFRVDRLAPEVELKLVRLVDPERPLAPPALFREAAPLPGNPADHQARLLALLRDERLLGGPLASPRARDLAAKLAARVLAGADLQGSGRVRQAFLHSGLFLERSRRQADGQAFDADYRVEDDNKALLSQFLAELDGIDRKYRQLQNNSGIRAYSLHANGMLSEDGAGLDMADGPGVLGLLGLLTRDSLGSVSLNQARTLDAQAAGIKAWYFDLHVQCAGQPLTVPVSITRDRDPRRDNDQAPAREDWRVEFSMHGGGFGSLDVTTRLRADSVDIGISTDRESTWAALEAHRAALADTLAAGGLLLERFECRLREAR